MALQTSFSPSSSSSSSCSFSSSSFSYAWKYHVFLSFRGPDTRHGFTGHLHKALCDKGIRTFVDDEELQRGEEITPSLAKAIDESRIAIPVFSKTYASSTFCLDELVKIMECVKGKGRLVLPVFYDVDPRDVRRQSGCYEEALARHEERFKDDKERVQKWREALRQAANLSGEDFKFGDEYECDFIAKIVKEISKRINRVLLHVADYLVGLQSRVLEVNRLLNDGSECGVHMVGIYGTGGIGKTTLAKAVYNSVADQFESPCFIENMSELSNRHGEVYLQEIVLSKILGDRVCNLGSVGEGISIIKERLCYKKVLLVLDNVDKHEHLKAIIGSVNELGSGSRVIITTRNKHLLTIHEAMKAYEVRVLNEKDAIELFSWKAFKFGKVGPGYMDILKKLVTYASHLPLALEAISSNLSGKCVEEWRSALDEYQKIPNGDVQMKLKVSFDALHPHEKNIFLDIACCFKGYKLTEVRSILHAHYDVDPTYTIRVLVDKSLIKTNGNYVTLHDLIQDMGREIVQSESPEEPGERSRLWLAKDIIEVLEGDKGSSKIQVINLECDYNGDVIEWDGLAFKKMEKLRTLIIRNYRFSQGPKYLPSSLRVLKWEVHPSQEYLPFYFHPKQLVICDLSTNCFDSVQLAKLLEKEFVKLRVLKFNECKRITKIPTLSCSPNLEELSFKWCGNVTEICESVGYLDKLRILNAFGCSQLRSLPPLMLPSLESLNISLCSSLESFPEILGKMESMNHLFVASSPIKKLPYSIHNLTGLQLLSFWDCGIVELPSSITLLKSLQFYDCKGLLLRNEGEGEEQVSLLPFSNATHLDVNGCNISEEFLRISIPLFPRLEFLCLRGGSFRILPECIKEFQFLRKLYLFDCKTLEEIRGIPPNIKELLVVGCTSLSSLTRRMLLNKQLHEEGQDKTFVLPGEGLPMWFEYRRRDSSFAFWFRNKFPAISFGFFISSGVHDKVSIRPELTINGAKSFQLVEYDSPFLKKLRGGVIFILSKTHTTFRVDEALSENEWNRAVISVSDDIEVGVHLIKEKSCMDDIHFTDPLFQRECDTLRGMGDSQTQTQFVRPQQQQQTNSAPLERQLGQGTELLSLPPAPPSVFINYVNRDLNSEEMSSSTTTTLNVQGSDDDSWMYDKKLLPLRPRCQGPVDCDNLESNLMQLASTTHTIMDQGCGTASRKRKRITPMLDLKNDPTGQSSNVIEALEDRIEDSFNEAEEQSSIRKRKASSSSVKTPAKIQKTAFEQNQEKDSDVEVLETSIVPTSISEANRGSYKSSIRAENADQPLNSLIEIQPPSPQPLDPLVELERLLLGSYDLTSESNSPIAASSADIQASEVVIILQNLEILLDNPLESLIADRGQKHQILDCLSKLGQLENHIPIPLQSIVAQIRDFYEDVIHNFPSIQQTLVDYSCLEETRSKFLENVQRAKVKKERIEAEVSQDKNQLEELAAEIADLEIKLKAAVEKQNKLQLAKKNGEAEKNKILKDAQAWRLESEQVVKKINSSRYTYRDAQNSKAILEGQLAALKRSLCSNKP